jgi:hypothetical protein
MVPRPAGRTYGHICIQQQQPRFCASGFQTFSVHRPLGSINSTPVSPALPYKKHSSEQRFAQPTEEDNNNAMRYRIQ